MMTNTSSKAFYKFLIKLISGTLMNTTIFGRLRIGHDTIIGGNVWLTQDVPANSAVLQTTSEIRLYKCD